MRTQLMARSSETGQRDVTGVVIDIECPLEIEAKPDDVLCKAGNRQYVFLSTTSTSAGDVSILNTHTFSQADFDGVGEVLLSPRPLGLLAISGQPLRALRRVFHYQSAPTLDADSCVTLHPIQQNGGKDYVIQNFNDRAVRVRLTLKRPAGKQPDFRDAFTGELLSSNSADSAMELTLDFGVPARGRIWVHRVTGTVH